MSSLTVIAILFISSIEVSAGQNTECQPTYSRESWGALPPRSALKDLAPVSHVFVHHTFDGDVCYDNDQCSQRVIQLQNYHQLTKKWGDIAWNFLIGGDGQIYDGIGWKKQGFHTLDWNNRSLGIAFIGNFNDENQIDDNVLDSMLGALDDILSCGLSIGQINSDYKLHGHRDAKEVVTKCPGDYLYSQLEEQFNSFEAGPF